MDHYQRSIEVTEEVLGKRHISYADTLNNIGNVLDDMGRYKEAILRYREAL